MNTTEPLDLKYIYTVHTTAVVVDALSLVASVMIIATLLCFPKLRQPRVWIMVVGISVGDILFSFHHGLDHCLSLTDIHHWPRKSPLCSYLAVGTLAGFWVQSAWILSMAGSLLYSFSHILSPNKQIPMNAIYIFTTTLALLPCIIALATDTLGRYNPSHPTWCHFDNETAELALFDVWVIIFSFLLFICYFFLGIKFKQLETQSMKNKAKKSLRRIILFPLIYSVQWFLYCVYTLLLYSHDPVPKGLVLGVVSTANAGGILNAVIYYGLMILGTRWKYVSGSTSKSNTDQSKPSERERVETN